MIDTWMEHIGGYGFHLYRVWHEGRIYTEFQCKIALTWSQEHDVAQLFRDAFEYWS